MAALIASPAPIIVNVDFDSTPASLDVNGSAAFVFSNNTANVSPYDTTVPFVAVMTVGGGLVYSPGGAVYSQQSQTAFPVSFGPQNQSDFNQFTTAAPIPYSAQDFTIALADLYQGQTYYGYATFFGTKLVSYAFQSSPGVAATLPAVPLPASAPLFGAAILTLGAFAYGRRRKRPAAAV